MKRLIIALNIIGLFCATEAVLCNPPNPNFATSIIYVGYPTSTITFDDLGFGNDTDPWVSELGPYTLYNNNGQTITVSGTSCGIRFGTQTLGSASWNSTGDWQNFLTYHPGHFLVLKADSGQCEFTFNPPIAEFAFRYNTNASPSGTLTIYDYYDHLISCSRMIQNPGYNYYNYTGFRGLVEIKRAVISAGVTVIDDFKWTVGCGESGVYDWQTCQPKSRCNDYQICNVTGQQYCTATHGTVSCSCPSGFSGDGFGSKGCTDFNDCANHPCADVATCYNCVGYYKCECPYGYSGLGYGPSGCQEIDECTTVYPCYYLATCVNHPGWYECLCPSGYDGNGLDTRYSNGTGCNDIDECKLAESPCSPVATCTNTFGAYECKCQSGYTGDGIGEFGCFDVNECDNSPCSPDATCTNTDGSYQCTCNAGYTGTGKGSNGCTVDATAPTSGPQSSTPIAKVSASPAKLTVLSLIVAAIIVVITIA